MSDMFNGCRSNLDAYAVFLIITSHKCPVQNCTKTEHTLNRKLYFQMIFGIPGCSNISVIRFLTILACVLSLQALCSNTCVTRSTKTTPCPDIFSWLFVRYCTGLANDTDFVLVTSSFIPSEYVRILLSLGAEAFCVVVHLWSSKFQLCDYAVVQEFCRCQLWCRIQSPIEFGT